MVGEDVELVANLLSGQRWARRLRPADRRRAARRFVAVHSATDTVEAAWRVVDPALRDDRPVLSYEPGSWGPAAAAKIIGDGEPWHDPQPRETGAPK